MDQIYWIVFASFIMPLFLGFGLTWFFIKYNKRQAEYLIERKDAQIREQELHLEKEREVNEERSRIAAEMHDELGGGLTAIRYLGHRAKKNIRTDKTPQIIDNMVERSTELINNMSEIIWAMNSHYDSIESLISYVRSYSRKFCSDCGLKYTELVPESFEDKNITGVARRNIFLVVKEALHNTVKHAQASAVELKICLEDRNLEINLSDNGVGIPDETKAFSNGLRNMENRLKDINGILEISSRKGGTTVNITYTLMKQSYERKN